MANPNATIELNCRDWTAVHDHMPVGGPTLRVAATCSAPTPGYRIELRPASPQGINPKIYILEKVVTRPERPAPDVITDIPVRYEEKTRTEYDSVLIRPDGVAVDVQDVH